MGFGIVNASSCWQRQPAPQHPVPARSGEAPNGRRDGSCRRFFQRLMSSKGVEVVHRVKVRTLRMTNRRVVAVTAAAAALLVLAACSSSGGDKGTSGSSTSTTSTSSTPASGSGSSTASSGGDIVVGGVTDGTVIGVDTGFEARIDRFNKDGGLNGRQVKFIGLQDDGGSQSTNLTVVQKLVLQDNVFAIAPYSSEAWNPASSQLLTAHNIPYIGWNTGGAPQCTGANAFPVNGCITGSPYVPTLPIKDGAALSGKPIADVKMALIGIDSSAGAYALNQYATAARSTGVDVVYGKAAVPATGTTDYSPYAQAIVAANPDVVYSLVDVPNTVGLTAALRQAGYTGKIFNPTAYLPGIINTQKQLAAALQGSYVAATFPPNEDGTPFTKQIDSDLVASKASSTQVTLGVLIGWESADEFVQELQATAKAGPVTSANFVKTIHAGFTYKPLAGGPTDMTYPERQTQPSTCVGVLLIEPGGVYKSIKPFACDPASLVKN
jgi:branched-chain amino acid transport system substrate-binding protein